MTQMHTVKIKPGCRHGKLHADYDSRRPTGMPGPYAMAGDVIEVTQAELDNFGDKFTLLDPVSAVLNRPNGTAPASKDEIIERLAVELEHAQSAQLEAELEASSLRVVNAKLNPIVRGKTTVTLDEQAEKPAARRARAKKAAPKKEA